MKKWILFSLNQFISSKEVRIVSIYFVLSIMWILTSDRLLYYFFSGASYIQILSIIKGWVFITLTSALLFYLIRKASIADSLALSKQNELQKKISSILENISDAFVSLDNVWRYTYMNKKAGELFNRDPEKMIGKHIWTEFPEGVGQPFYNNYYKAVKEQLFIQMEEYYPPYDKWFENRIYPSKDGLTIFFYDITARKKNEIALQESKQYSQLLFNSSPIGLALASMDGKLIEVNPAFAKIVGRTISETLQLTYWDLTPNKYAKQEVQQLELLNSIGHYGPYEKEYFHKDGHLVPVRLQGLVINKENEKFIWSSVEDISQRKKMELLVESEMKILEMIAKRNTLAEILESIVLSIETQTNKYFASILLLDRDGIHVRYGAAPNLPGEYNTAIDGEPIGPSAGSCGTAMFLKQQVIVNDIETDPLWTEYKALALKHNLKACWSTPIIDSTGKVLGSFAMYSSELCSPNREDFQLIEKAIHLAKIAIIRKTEEEVLSDSENKFSKIFLNSPDAITITKASDGTFIEVNENFCNLSGYKRDEVIGRTTIQLGLWADLDDRNKYLSILRDNNHVSEFETLFRTKTHEIKNFLLSGEIIELTGETCIIGILRDITERKKSEENLNQSRIFIESIINTSPDIIYIYDIVEGQNVFVNNGIQTNLGYTNEEIKLMGKQLLPNLMHPDDFNYYIQSIYPQYFKVRDKEFIVNEYRMRDKNNAWHWLYCKESVFLRDSNGNPKHIFGITVDITARKIAEQATKRNEHILKLFVENSPASIAMFDLDMKYIVASRRYLLDYDLGDIDIIGISHYQIFPEMPHRWKEIHNRCLAGATEKCEEDPFHRLDGKIDWVRWEIRPWFETENIIGGIILFSEVITDRINNEKELKLYRDHLELLVKQRTSELEIEKIRAESADKLKSAFLATMSHELRSPLNSIIGFSGILAQEFPGKLNDEQKKQISLVQSSARHLLSLINDVLDLSKIEAGQLKVSFETFNIRNILLKVINAHKPLAERKNILLLSKFDSDVENIISDPLRVEQILINLINNAIKFTEKGSVSVLCSKTDSDLIIKIIDTGIGIEENLLNHLFKPFSQIDTGLTRKQEGTGLGLSICKKLLVLLHGSIEVISTINIGSTFTITLPLEGIRINEKKNLNN